MAKTKTRLNVNQRKRLVKGLVANCEGLADAGEATLLKLSDEKLVSMARNVAARKAKKLKRRLEREDGKGETRNKKRKPSDRRQPTANSAEKRRKQRLQSRRRTENEGIEDDEDEESEDTGRTRKSRKKAALNSQGPVTEKEYLRAAPPSIRRMLRRLTQNEQKQKEALVDKILDNENNKFTEKFLMKKSVPELQGLVSLCDNEYDDEDGAPMFIGAATPARNGRGIDDRQEDILPLPTMNWGPDEEEDDDDDLDDVLNEEEKPRNRSNRKKPKRRQRA